MDSFKDSTLPLVSMLDVMYVYSNNLGSFLFEGNVVFARGIVNHLSGSNVLGLGDPEF